MLAIAGLLAISIFIHRDCVAAEPSETPLPQAWDYVPAMQKVASRFQGRHGVVLHVGDSITYSNPYGGWARSGEGKTDADLAALKWMHAGADDDSDGWWLARFDHPAGGRSYTACSGIRSSEMLAGGKQQMPSLEKIVEQYRPQIVVLMLGTNDACASRHSTADLPARSIPNGRRPATRAGSSDPLHRFHRTWANSH